MEITTPPFGEYVASTPSRLNPIATGNADLCAGVQLHTSAAVSAVSIVFVISLIVNRKLCIPPFSDRPVFDFSPAPVDSVLKFLRVDLPLPIVYRIEECNRIAVLGCLKFPLLVVNTYEFASVDLAHSVFASNEYDVIAPLCDVSFDDW
jgi:hypothetical protein